MSYPAKAIQQSFTVPAGAGSYAPEIVYTNMFNLATVSLDPFDRLVLLISSLPATCNIEVDLLKPGSDPNGGDTSYYLAGSSAIAAITTTGYKGNILGTSWFNGWCGARIRAKSGGSAGSAIVGILWGVQ